MRRQISGTWHLAVATLVTTLALVGCDSSGGAGSTTAGGGTAKTTKTTKEDDHDHDHDHGDHKEGDHKEDDHKHDDEKEGHDDHDHAHHGPNGGDLIEVGEEEYHLELTHGTDGKVVVYVLDAAGKKEVGVDQSSITIETKVGEETNTYELSAVKPSEGAKASKFEIVDPALLGVVESLGEAVKATVKELKIGDKTFTDVKIEKHEHDH